MADVLLPELGEDIKYATVACWHVKAGDTVAVDVDLVELVTDKASFNVPSPVSGKVSEIFFPEGETAKVGAVLARIQEEE